MKTASSRTHLRRRVGVTVVLLFTLLAITTGASGAPLTVQQWRDYQDQLLKAGLKDRLLKECRDRVKASETALNRFLLGRAYVKTQDVVKARPEFERALELDPLFAPACQGLAICMLQRGEVEGAVQTLKRGVDLDPKDVESKLMLAELLARTNRLPAAEKILGEVLTENPKRFQARFLLARIYIETRPPRIEKARDELRVVLQQEPRHLPARRVLSACLGMLEDWEGAEKELREIIAAVPDDPEPRFMLAEILAKTGKTDDARKILIELRERKPGPEIEKKIEAALAFIAKLDRGLGNVRTVGDLIDKLESEDVRVRRQALHHLSKLDFEHGVPRAIVKLVLDPDEDVRVRVVRLMGRAKDLNTLAVLSLKLGHEKDKDKSKVVRGACVDALRALDTEAVVPVLLAALADTESYVRELALRALRHRCGKRFVSGSPSDVAVEKADECRRLWWGWWTSDKAKYRKIRAAEGLAASNLLAMARFVVPMLADPDPEVFGAAYAAFRSLTKKSFGELDNDPATRARIAKEAREWWKAEAK